MNCDLINSSFLNNDIKSLVKKRTELIVSWNFFAIKSSSINTKNINDGYDHTINKKYKTKLLHFIHYNKNIIKLYNKSYNKPLSKEYFKIIASSLLKDEKQDIKEFKTVPILILENIAIIGIIFIIDDDNRNHNTFNYNKINYNILYKKIFLIDIDKSLTRFNNINIIKGIINSSFNKDYLEDKITILSSNLKNILNKNIHINCSLLYLLNILQKYFWILKFKI